jgi:hypothetical protein
MDLSKTISELIEEKEKLERVITSLEELASTMAGKPDYRRGRAGRKFMGAEERQQVSARMKRYWAERRRQR